MKDSLKQNEYSKVVHSELLGIPEQKELTINHENKFTFFLQPQQLFPNYNVYRIKNNGEKEVRELLYKDYNKSRFEFSFFPESEKDNSFDLLVEFHLDSLTVQIPGGIDMSLLK